MANLIVFPDVEAGLVEYLSGKLGIPASTRVPSPRPANFVRVLTTGGPGVRAVVIDQAQVTVESFGPDEEAAATTAAMARALIANLPGRRIAGALVVRVEELSRPQNLPDPATDQSRYTFTDVVHVRGTAAPA